MSLEKIKISNYKIFKSFEYLFNPELNIIVGDNEVGKSTFIEAIHLALTGMINGKSIHNEITEYLFNRHTIQEYLLSLTTNDPMLPPEIKIELYFANKIYPKSMGWFNSDKKKDATGIIFSINFDENYKNEYENLIKYEEIRSLPIEYYEVKWMTFGDMQIKCRENPIKSILIDSSTAKYQNGSDIYISQILKNNLNTDEVIHIAQAHRKMRDEFEKDKSIENINSRLKELPEITEKDIKISVELLSKNAWENSLQTCIDNIPFHHIGKGEQSIIKTNLALLSKKAASASIILIEEPENHLTFSRLNKLINIISNSSGGRQIVITTHSSFVANKLGLKDIILFTYKYLQNNTIKFLDITSETYLYFKKLSGYDTLRFILCKSIILVEGPSDELIIQRAYKQKYNKLPIENSIDVMSVGTSFNRFLEIADKLHIKVAVVTDNDGQTIALDKKYYKYRDSQNIHICYDKIDRTPEIQTNKNYNTLEYYMIIENGIGLVEQIIGTSFNDREQLFNYMINNKTECALRFFEYEGSINIPSYIMEAIQHVGE